MVLEGLRTDLEWFGNILAHLEREKPPPLAALLDVELERLRSSLGTPDNRNPDPRDEVLRRECGRMQSTVLGRRLRLELLRPVNGSGPEALWMQRFHLSRLQAQYSALNLAHHSEPGNAAYTADADDWLVAVMRRRASSPPPSTSSSRNCPQATATSLASESCKLPSTKLVKRSPSSKR